MTDKQIIIDSVDVSGCSWYTQGATGMICADWHISNDCSKNPNCNYKQHKRKEQECEELKIYIESNEQQVKEVETLVMDNDRLINELDQLKAELEQEKAWHKTSDEISKVNSEYTAKLKAENEVLEKVNKANQEKIKKLNEQLEEEFIAKQYGDEALFFTLMDIKELAKRYIEVGVSGQSMTEQYKLKGKEELAKLILQICEVIDDI